MLGKELPDIVGADECVEHRAPSRLRRHRMLGRLLHLCRLNRLRAAYADVRRFDAMIGRRHR